MSAFAQSDFYRLLASSFHLENFRNDVLVNDTSTANLNWNTSSEMTQIEKTAHQLLQAKSNLIPIPSSTTPSVAKTQMNNDKYSKKSTTFTRPVTGGAIGILLHLEQLTKSQFQEEAKDTKNSSNCKKNSEDVKKLNQVTSSSMFSSPNKQSSNKSMNNLTKNEAKNDQNESNGKNDGNSKGNASLWPAWVYCTRYSDRPSAGNFICFIKDFLCVFIIFFFNFNLKN